MGSGTKSTLITVGNDCSDHLSFRFCERGRTAQQDLCQVADWRCTVLPVFQQAGDPGQMFF
jgi:hypothetical protein